jgi:hypothetical protein
MRLTRNTWVYLAVGAGGSAAVWWFCWALQATSIFTGQPPSRGGASPALIAWVITPFFTAAWAWIGFMTLRRRGSWILTRDQADQARVRDEEADRRTAEWREAARLWRMQETVEQTRASLARLTDLQDQYGDNGTIAFFLGWPIEDVLRVTGEPTMSTDQERK